MGKLISIVGTSGAGKTTLVHELCHKRKFSTGLEQHDERPFQALFKQDARYALANQMDYLLLRAEQELELRASPLPALTDGGLDLDFHGFTRLFHARGYLKEAEFLLCQRQYMLTRSLLPQPDLIIYIEIREEELRRRLSNRNRINIASYKDTNLLDQFLREWVTNLAATNILRFDVSNCSPNYNEIIPAILTKIDNLP